MKVLDTSTRKHVFSACFFIVSLSVLSVQATFQEDFQTIIMTYKSIIQDYSKVSPGDEDRLDKSVFSVEEDEDYVDSWLNLLDEFISESCITESLKLIDQKQSFCPQEFTGLIIILEELSACIQISFGISVDENPALIEYPVMSLFFSHENIQTKIISELGQKKNYDMVNSLEAFIGGLVKAYGHDLMPLHTGRGLWPRMTDFIALELREYNIRCSRG